MDVVSSPFVVLVDGREKAPYTFTGLRSDASLGRKTLVIPTEWAHLKTGDYTVRGIKDSVTVERKSLEDLYSTLGQHRDRFEAEHERLAEFKRAVVIVEASWTAILKAPPARSKLNPKTVFRTAMSWYVRYGVPWFTADGRRMAEVMTYRFLEKAFREFGRGNSEDD